MCLSRGPALGRSAACHAKSPVRLVKAPTQPVAALSEVNAGTASAVCHAKSPVRPVNHAAGRCVCSEGQRWDGKRCVPRQVACPPGQSRDAAGRCVCPEGQRWDGKRCVPRQVACPPGQSRDATGRCVCPQGQRLDGKRCVPRAPAPKPTPAPGLTPVPGHIICPTGTVWALCGWWCNDRRDSRRTLCWICRRNGGADRNGSAPRPHLPRRPVNLPSPSRGSSQNRPAGLARNNSQSILASCKVMKTPEIILRGGRRRPAARYQVASVEECTGRHEDRPEAFALLRARLIVSLQKAFSPTRVVQCTAGWADAILFRSDR